MAKESTTHIENNRLVFRETFNNLQETISNGGSVTDVTFSNGVGEFNGTSSYIAYSNAPALDATTSIRIILTHTDTDDSQDWVVDFGDSSQYVDLQSENVYRSVGTIYVNGVAASTYSMNEVTEIVVTGFVVQGDYFRIGSQYDDSQWFEGNIELVEIYNYSLSAEEVLNLYEGKRFNELTGQIEILNVSAASGSIIDRWGNTLTPTNVEVRKFS